MIVLPKLLNLWSLEIYIPSLRCLPRIAIAVRYSQSFVSPFFAHDGVAGVLEFVRRRRSWPCRSPVAARAVVSICTLRSLFCYTFTISYQEMRCRQLQLSVVRTARRKEIKIGPKLNDYLNLPTLPC
jgi:hypothetical protein